jgi:hypothetical protein
VRLLRRPLLRYLLLLFRGPLFRLLPRRSVYRCCSHSALSPLLSLPFSFRCCCRSSFRLVLPHVVASAPPTTVFVARHPFHCCRCSSQLSIPHPSLLSTLLPSGAVAVVAAAPPTTVSAARHSFHCCRCCRSLIRRCCRLCFRLVLLPLSLFDDVAIWCCCGLLRLLLLGNCFRSPATVALQRCMSLPLLSCLLLCVATACAVWLLPTVLFYWHQRYCTVATSVATSLVLSAPVLSVLSVTI